MLPALVAAGAALLRGALAVAKNPAARRLAVVAAKRVAASARAVGTKAKQLTKQVVQKCRQIANRNVKNIPAGLRKPQVSDKILQSKLDKLYRPGAKTGSGSTADAVRLERLTGKPVGGKWHTQKAQDSINELSRWIRKNPQASPADRTAAQSVIDDMANALRGN